MSYQVHNFKTGEIIEAPPINEMDAQILYNSEHKCDVSEKGTANGIATLDSNGKVQLGQMPYLVATTTETQAIINEY